MTVSSSTNSIASNYTISLNSSGTTSGGTIAAGQWQINGPSPGQATCGHATLDGGQCELPPSFDDDRCHWHTSEQCYAPTDDGSPCELPGSGPDGRCHIHTTGCNESLTHTTLEKAAYHGLKFPYRMLGLHRDTDWSDGPFEVQPEAAATVAAEVASTYLRVTAEEYDREESHEYYLDNIVSKVADEPDGVVEKIKSEFDYFDNGMEKDILKEGIDKMWTQLDDKENHADACRTAIAAAEHYLGIEVDV